MLLNNISLQQAINHYQEVGVSEVAITIYNTTFLQQHKDAILSVDLQSLDAVFLDDSNPLDELLLEKVEGKENQDLKMEDEEENETLIKFELSNTMNVQDILKLKDKTEDEKGILLLQVLDGLSDNERDSTIKLIKSNTTDSNILCYLSPYTHENTKEVPAPSMDIPEIDKNILEDPSLLNLISKGDIMSDIHIDVLYQNNSITGLEQFIEANKHELKVEMLFHVVMAFFEQRKKTF
eukprot:CAMPEP_0117418372 /NCGR_PEP_ID=MMETSP0758-20121206/163_1 /TAXON_ID=63605 /ORGANISM="Percolomonas cosmopolitus, Strain AE-1 (ATCC 50343)" /LENGTH=236 /DNA_ID=CAMNT_0005198829 /DNA_START=368 /DNA_END=1078 /DNA_ORIENTATION=+